VLVMIEGRPLNLNWAAEHVPAILTAWYPGEQGGSAIADVLFGDYNPAGRLPISIPRSVGQLPVYYNHKPDSRREYVDESASPLYAFGHGLSYSRFQYSNARAAVMEKPGEVTVSIAVEVTNAGPRDGDEVVQCYLHDEVSSVTTPFRALKAVRRMHLKAGEKQSVEFKLGPNELALLDRRMKWVVEPGEFGAMIGGASDNARAEAKFSVQAEVLLR
jgi:beta-glucosidase